MTKPFIKGGVSYFYVRTLLVIFGKAPHIQVVDDKISAHSSKSDLCGCLMICKQKEIYLCGPPIFNQLEEESLYTSPLIMLTII